ncbi:hypothetical protein HELRODRAFT_158069 [Helobdella robusta]|uniref:diphosphoinositol-polyphosphate diphosphatase n=1 Tax=Helobdella robusta TaxID=6412 RepID=T1EMJ0_HELRO|nr:hypothetical protein HELRODRAFT_158069 [Helobdella robusta]ESN91025.1 hypothetical protein HELRODRAFT_158069 [Helobdella robusta]
MAKQKTARTYDDDGFRRRAACVCVKDCNETEILLVSANRDPELWIIPGGGIEPTEDIQVAALREVLEEAGVKGRLDRCLGVFESMECKTRTFVFVMVVGEVLDEWDEMISIGRKRRWFPVDEARHHLKMHRPAHLLYLDNLNNNNNSNNNNNNNSNNNNSSSSSSNKEVL